MSGQFKSGRDSLSQVRTDQIYVGVNVKSSVDRLSQVATGQAKSHNRSSKEGSIKERSSQNKLSHNRSRKHFETLCIKRGL